MVCILRFCYLTTVVFLLAVFCQAQNKLRTIDELNPDYTYRNKPVEIVGRKFRGIPLSGSSLVTGDKDWLKDLSFQVKNIADKSVTFLRLACDPKTRETDRTIATARRVWTPGGGFGCRRQSNGRLCPESA